MEDKMDSALNEKKFIDANQIKEYQSLNPYFLGSLLQSRFILTTIKISFLLKSNLKRL